MLFEIWKTIPLSTVGLLCVFSDLVFAAVGPEKTKLVFYYGPEHTDSTSYNLSDARNVLVHSKFINNETHFYLHGFHESQDSESIHVIVAAYMKRRTVNLLAIDWAMAASENYLSAALDNTEKLAPALADMFLGLYNAGLKRETLTVVAHSLGGQLAGMTGRHIIKKSNGTVKIHRMAVLDPAFPLFSKLFFLQTVSQKDAEFLQAIHTDIGTYGQPISLGHIDFWPNGGRQGQPGCPTGFLIPFSKEGDIIHIQLCLILRVDLCSHQRSWRFWAESVANVNGPEFWSFPSTSYVQFLANGIANLKDKAVQMGFNCPLEARGSYYLKTNSESPYAMGLGLDFE